jgi:hypothetical protein
MNLAPIKEGDIVRVDHKGRIFLAFVEGKAPQALLIKPLDKRVNYFQASAREVKEHWRKRKS